MTRTVCLTFTQLEAEALSYAAFNSLNALEDAEAVFGGRQREISAAYRAAKKLDHAIAKSSLRPQGKPS